MTTINFPSSPSTNDTYSFNGKTYVFDGTKWKIQRTLVSADTDLLAVDSGIVPDTNITYDLGSSTKRWRDLYLSGNTIDLNGIQISADETGVILPEGSKIGTNEIGSGSASASTLTKTFEENETASITLSNPVTVTPLVSATKEISQTGIVSKGAWDVRANGSNYSIYDSAYDDTLTPSDSSANGTFTLGVGSFAATDVGKKITGNGGEAILLDTAGNYLVTTPFNDTSTIASGDWSMFGLTFDDTDGVKISGINRSYDLSTASYDSVSFYVYDHNVVNETNPKGVTFNNDGTKMYIIGSGTDSVHQYTLSTAFDLSTALYDGVSFSVRTQENSPESVTFNNDGTKMYVVGTTYDNIHQYTLSTAFDLSTVSYDSVSFAVGSQETASHGMVFNNDGTKMYIVGSDADAVKQYSLATAFDLSTVSYDSVSFDVSGQDGYLTGIVFNNDGTKMYIAGRDNARIYQYSLATAFNLSTASYDNVSFDVSGLGTAPSSITFNNDGTKMYTADTGSIRIYQYSVGVIAYATNAYHSAVTNSAGQIDSRFWVDINSMSADETLNGGTAHYAISTDNHTTWSIIDNTDGVRNIVRNNSGTWEYNDANTFDGETWVSATVNEELPAIQESLEEGNAVKTVGFGDVSTWTDDSVSLSIAGTSGYTVKQRGGLAFNNDGTKMFASTDDAFIAAYTLTTPYDISTATFDFTGGRYYYPSGIKFNNDGTKFYLPNDNNNEVLEFTTTAPFEVRGATETHSLATNSQTESPVGLTFNDTGSKMFVVDYITDVIHQYDLSTPFDLSTATYNSISFSVASVESNLQDIAFNADGTKMYVGGTGSGVSQWSLSTPYDITTASYDLASFAVPETNMRGMTVSHDGTKMYTVGYDSTIRQHSIGSQSNYNRMTNTQLSEVTDANHFTLGDSLDLAIILSTDNATAVPESDGISINYDAEALNKSAVVGVDYEFDFPDESTVRVTSLTNQNLKVKILEA